MPNKKFDTIRIAVLRETKKIWKKSIVLQMLKTFILRNSNVERFYVQRIYSSFRIHIIFF